MVLKDFINLCEKHNVIYFLFAGTTLGAIRHGGFIPWDDDIDIIMPRREYEKFLKIADVELKEKYDLLEMNKYDDYYLAFAKLSLKGTKFVERLDDKLSFNIGIGIDIFPLDKVPSNNFKGKFYAFRCRILAHLLINSVLKISNPSKIKRTIQNILYYLLKIIPSFTSFIKSKINKLYPKYVDIDSEYLIQHFDTGGIIFYNAKDFKTVKKVKFEDIEANVPCNYDGYLTHEYGDYMELPPEDKRINHAPEFIDFGKY